jgi:hypothetical protein
MRIGSRALIVSFAVLCAFVVLSCQPLSESQNEKGATFIAAKYSTRVRSQTSDLWNFTVHNADCSENDQGSARFFLDFYLDDNLWFDEYNSTAYMTWSCDKGKTVSHAYIKNWPDVQPFAHDMRVELYWFDNGTSHLEDTLSFKTTVTVPVTLQHIIPTSYIALYLIACAILLTYDYVASLE